MKKHLKALSAAVGLLILSACGGGGGGSSNGPVTIGGVAIDGYLANAKVCLDLNLNFKCDPNEPSAITGNGGTYSLTYTGGDPSGLVVITETTKDTRDSDDGGELTFEAANRSPFVLAAPVPVGATTDVKITPLTTVVTTNALTENVSGNKLSTADITAAVTALQATLGVASNKDLLKLDVAQDTSLKPVAQVLSHTLGEIQKAVTDNDASKMKTAVLAAANTVTGLLTDGQLPASVTSALAKPAVERAAALKQIDEVKTAIASTSKTVNLGGSTMDPKQVLKDGLVIAEISNGYNPVDALKEASIGDWKQGKFLEVQYLKYDADTKAYAEIRRVLDKTWVKRAKWGSDYSLTSNGAWVLTEGAPFEKGLVSFEKNCVVLSQNTDLSYSERVCIDEKDLSNLVISEINPGYCDRPEASGLDVASCKTAKFKQGSKGYEATFSTTGSDAYTIWVPNRASDLTYHYGKNVGATEVKTIPDFVNALVNLKGNSNYSFGIDSVFSITLKTYDASTGKGTFAWLYNHDNDWNTPSQDAGESSFEVKSVAGTTVLVFKPSLKYLQVNRGDMVGRDFLFAAKDGQIRKGEVQYKDVRQQLGLNAYNWLGNKAMLESILSGLKFNDATLPEFPFSAESNK